MSKRKTIEVSQVMNADGSVGYLVKSLVNSIDVPVGTVLTPYELKEFIDARGWEVRVR